MQKVLITGAASGLGRELAIEFARHGAQVCLADINQQGSEETLALVERAGGSGFIHSLDVRQEREWIALRESIIERWGALDVVVNNAGVAAGDRIDAGEWAWWEWIIDINLKGVALGCRTFASMLKQQGHGHFLNVASLAGLLKLPSMASYNATKAGVIAITETLHFELMPYGVGATALCPSFFRTNLNTSMKTSDPNMLKFVDKVFAASSLNATDIAQAAYRAIQKNQRLCIPHPEGKRAYWLKTFLPVLFNRTLLNMAQGLKRKEPQ